MHMQTFSSGSHRDLRIASGWVMFSRTRFTNKCTRVGMGVPQEQTAFLYQALSLNL